MAFASYLTYVPLGSVWKLQPGGVSQPEDAKAAVNSAAYKRPLPSPDPRAQATTSAASQISARACQAAHAALAAQHSQHGAALHVPPRHQQRHAKGPAHAPLPLIVLAKPQRQVTQALQGAAPAAAREAAWWVECAALEEAFDGTMHGRLVGAGQ